MIDLRAGSTRPRKCWSVFGAMSAERVVYLDSSALVKLAVAEPQSAALRRSLRRQPACVTSALARTEVPRALLQLGLDATTRAEEVLRRVEIVRISDRVLRRAGALEPPEMRSLGAIHLATAQLIEPQLKYLVTYDERMTNAAAVLRIRVRAPA